MYGTKEKTFLKERIYDKSYVILDNINNVVVLENDELIIDVPAGHVFLLGDNRPNSLDSRSYGCISVEDIRGQYLFSKQFILYR